MTDRMEGASVSHSAHDPTNPFAPPIGPIPASDPGGGAGEDGEKSRENRRAERFLRALELGNRIGAALTGCVSVVCLLLMVEQTRSGFYVSPNLAISLGAFVFVSVGSSLQLSLAKGLRERQRWARRIQFGLSAACATILLGYRLLFGPPPTPSLTPEWRDTKAVLDLFFVAIHGYIAYRITTAACARVSSPAYLEARDQSAESRPGLGLQGVVAAIVLGLACSLGIMSVSIIAAGLLTIWLTPFIAS